MTDPNHPEAERERKRKRSSEDAAEVGIAPEILFAEKATGSDTRDEKLQMDKKTLILTSAMMKGWKIKEQLLFPDKCS